MKLIPIHALKPGMRLGPYTTKEEKLQVLNMLAAAGYVRAITSSPINCSNLEKNPLWGYIKITDNKGIYLEFINYTNRDTLCKLTSNIIKPKEIPNGKDS